MHPSKPYLGLPMVIWSLEGDAPVRINAGFIEATGLELEELKGTPLMDWIHPEDKQALGALVKGGHGQLSARFKSRTQSWVSLDWRLQEQGGASFALGLVDSGAQVPFASPAASIPAEKDPLYATLDAMALIVEAKHPGMRCSILLVDDKCEYITLGAGPSFPDAYNRCVEGLRIGPSVGSCGTAAYWNVPVVVEDIALDPLWDNLRDAAKLAGALACWSHPVTGMGGQVLGAMALYDVEPRAPKQHQLDSLAIAARMVGLAIERRRMERQLGQATKMEALGVLAGGIAHDFKNLLSVILGNAELALGNAFVDAQARGNLQAIVKASVNATDICSQMLAYAGRETMVREPIECHWIMREMGGLLEVAISKNIELIYGASDEALAISADPSQIRQVIMNLITNAAEAMGQAEGQIHLSAQAYTCSGTGEFADRDGHPVPAGEYVMLLIADSGPGLEPGMEDRIFDPFFSTKAAGSGLGLAAVQGIIQGHGGFISVDSKPGVGTSFRLYLPRVAMPRPAFKEQTMHKQKVEQACILVVDDEPEVLLVMGAMLEQGGYDVLCASGGLEALKLYRTHGHRIDCVLLDLSMPKLDGGEVFQKLQEMKSDVCVVLTSGFAEQQVLKQFRDKGLAGVLPKPASMAALLETIGSALNNRNLVSEPSA